jgi:periplasmic protein TonB
LVEFTVTAEGRVEDVEVIESTSSVFTRAALSAVRQWRYWPRRENGIDVPRTGVQTQLDFVFEDGED